MPSTLAAAQQIFNQFDRYNTQVRAAAICNDYAASALWDNALRQCDVSLAINPRSIVMRFQRGRILYELKRMDEALEEFDRVLTLDPLHDEALQLAGYIATVSGDADAGRILLPLPGHQPGRRGDPHEDRFRARPSG